MRSAKRWFKLVLGVLLVFFVTTSVVPVVTSPAYAQGVFGHKQSGSQTSNEKQKQEQAEKDRQAKEQAEKERQAKEQAERQAQQQAERDRQAREQAKRDKQAKEQAEREKQAKEQQERQEREAAAKRAQELKEQQAKEQAERQAREQAEREKQAREQAAREQAERDRKAKEEIDHQAALKAAEAERAERERVLRESQEKAEQQRQAKEQADREAREKAAREAQARADQRNRNRAGTPTNPSARSGEKFERVGERPANDGNQGSRDYHPQTNHSRTYYPYDPGYRNQPPVYYPVPVPVPVPSEPVPFPVPVPAPSSNPEVIVIDRGPTDHPEPQPPAEEEDNVPDVQAPENSQPADESADESVTEESVEPGDAGPEVVRTEPLKKQVDLPEIPSELLKPAEPGSPTETLHQICLGWLTGDMKLIEKHIDPDVPVRIYKRAKFSHKLSPEEFTELTADGLEQMNTREYKLEQVNKKYGKIYARGVHTYLGADGKPHRVILAYTLKKLKGVWAIVEVGYSTMAKVETKEQGPGTTD